MKKLIKVQKHTAYIKLYLSAQGSNDKLEKNLSKQQELCSPFFLT